MSEERKGGGAPIAEWLVALFGAALVVGAVAFLLYQALAVKAGPPDIVLEAGAPIAAAQGYLVPVTVRNEGGRTVAGLTITGALEQEGQPLESSDATLDYVPARSARHAGLFFERDPGPLELKLALGGFQEP